MTGIYGIMKVMKEKMKVRKEKKILVLHAQKIALNSEIPSITVHPPWHQSSFSIFWDIDYTNNVSYTNIHPRIENGILNKTYVYKIFSTQLIKMHAYFFSVGIYINKYLGGRRSDSYSNFSF